MRVFIHNIESSVGQALTSVFQSSSTDDDEYEVVGSIVTSSNIKIPVTTVITSEDSTETLHSLLKSCDIVIYDIEKYHVDAIEALQFLKSSSTESSSVKFIAISSILTWSRTPGGSSYTEDQYKLRKPSRKYATLKATETQVMSLNCSNVKTIVVASGLLYGGTESVFNELWKTAWEGKPLPLLSNSTSPLPVTSTTALANNVLKCVNSEKPYVFAIETRASVADITAVISSSLGTGQVLDNLDEEERANVILKYPSSVAPLQFNIDLASEEEGSSSSSLINSPNDWALNYITSFNLKPLRIVVGGVPGLLKVFKKQITSKLCKKYYLQEIATDDTSQLSSIGSKNQGYVFSAAINSFEQAKELFKPSVEETSTEEVEEEEVKQKARPLLLPTHVILFDVDDEYLLSTAANLTEEEAEIAGVTDQEAFKASVQSYREAEKSLASFFEEECSLEVLEILQTTTEDEEDSEIVYNYIEAGGGAPNNFHPTEEEAAEITKQAEEREASLAASNLKAQNDLDAAEAKDFAERQKQTSERLKRLEEEESTLLASKSLPLRSYLMTTIIPALTEGMLEVVKTQPEDPIDFLSEFLFEKGNELENK